MNFSKNNRTTCGVEIKNSILYTQPVLTIAIPTYKRPVLLRESVLSAINQCKQIEYEILIIDNDDSGEFLDQNIVTANLSKNIRYILNKNNLGMFGNWNQTILNCRTKYISILNDDDLLAPDFLEHVNALIDKYDLIYTSCIGFSKRSDLMFSNKKSIRYRKLKKSDYFWRNPSNGSLGIVFNRSLLSESDLFDEGDFPISDYRFFYNYFLKHGGVKTQIVLAGYRWAENESLKKNVLEAFLVKSYFLRKDMILNSRRTGWRVRLLEYLSLLILHKHYFGVLEINRHVSFSSVCIECDIADRRKYPERVGKLKSLLAFVMSKIINF